jgi:glycosyltransferase 2 family protein
MHASQPAVRHKTSLPKSMRQILLFLMRLGVGFGLLAYLAESKSIDLSTLSRLFTAWPISIGAITLLLLDLALMAWRLCWLFHPHGMHLPLGASLRLTLVGSFFASFLPGRAGGDLARVFYASRESSGRRTEIISVLIFDRAIGLFSMLILPLLLAPIFPELLRATVVRVALATAAILALGMLIAFLACVFIPSMVHRLARGPLGFPAWRELVVRFLGTITAYSRSPGTLIAALSLALVGNLTCIAVTALALVAVQPARLAARLCVLVPIGQIVNSLPISPGGLGVGEAAFNALFKIAGLQGGAEALLCCRIWTILVSILGLAFYLRGFRGRVFSPNFSRPTSAGDPAS